MNAVWARRLLRFRGLAVLVASLAAPPVCSVAAQQIDQVQDRQLAYEAARSGYQAAIDARNVREKQWNDALEEHEQASRSGDAARENTALVRALDLSRELDLADRRANQEKRTLDAARNVLLTAIDARTKTLTAQRDAARTAAERARYGALLRDLDVQQTEIEAERDQAVTVKLVYYPSIQFDMRDTPESLTAKAQLLRRKAETADSALAQIDRQIQRIERQLRQSRNVQSLVTGVERFGDVQVPVGAPNRRTPQGDVPARPDSAGVARPEITPQQQVRELRLLRFQIQEAKRQFLDRASTFDQMVRRIGE